MYSVMAVCLAAAGGCVAGVILHATITQKVATVVATIRADIAKLTGGAGKAG